MNNPLKNRSEQMAEQWSTDRIGRQGDPDAPVGSEEWAAYVANEIHSRVKDAESDARQAEGWIEDFKSEDGHKALGFESWDEFCKSWIGYEAEQVETIISRRKRAQKKAGEYDGPEEAEDVLPQNGENQHTLDGGCSNQNTLNRGGGDTDYLTARIARDHEEIHEKMKAGEYRSVRQAAIDAGIIEDRTRVSFYADDPKRACKNIFKHMVREDIEQLRSRLTDELDDAD